MSLDILNNEIMEAEYKIQHIPPIVVLLIWTSVCEICLNHEVLMFQHFTETSLDLGSISIVNIY